MKYAERLIIGCNRFAHDEIQMAVLRINYTTRGHFRGGWRAVFAACCEAVSHKGMKTMNRKGMRAMNKKIIAMLLLTSGFSTLIPFAYAESKPPVAATQKRINFMMLTVADLARAESFYTRALGMKVVLRPQDEVALNISGDINSPEPLLFLKKVSDAKSQPEDAAGIGLQVPDVAAVVDQVRASGYTIAKAAEAPLVVSAPGVKPVVTMTKALVRDPDGYIIELVQLRTM
jgi:catechol 2,3-dioxygenase-like lactoylglutathione lyase family enzyme